MVQMFRHDDGLGHIYFKTEDGSLLANVHRETVDCYKFGCVVHFPSNSVANQEGWPYNWRVDRGIMERFCKHGVGHPDADSAAWFRRMGKDFENVHGCCGCDCTG